jgi:hypothetical protein
MSGALNWRVLWFERPTLVKRFEARALTEPYTTTAYTWDTANTDIDVS